GCHGLTRIRTSQMIEEKRDRKIGTEKSRTCGPKFVFFCPHFSVQSVFVVKISFELLGPFVVFLPLVPAASRAGLSVVRSFLLSVPPKGQTGAASCLLTLRTWRIG